MPHFCYEAKDPQGNFATGVAVGPGHLDVVKELKAVGYEVLRVWQKPPMLPGFRFWGLMNQVPLSELALLTRELGMFFTSGVGLLRGLEAIKDQGFTKQTGRAAEDVAKSLASGLGLSQSMALRPDVFEPVYVRMIHAGEASGALDKILDKLSDYLERELLLRRRVKSALAYPALIFLVCVGLTAFMVFFLFPTFIGFFDGLDMRLPAITESLMTLTSLSREPIFIIAILLLPFVINQIVKTVRSNEARMSWLSNVMLGLPVVGLSLIHI